jgi:quinol-cytochrome oxidoreductase complex cytochrome b subunit
MSEPMTEDQSEITEENERHIPFFPDYLLDEVIAWYVALALLVVLASLFPAGLEEKATPLSTPAHVKPEWYFLFFYQFLKIAPRTVGVVAMGVGAVFLFLIPFLDRSPSRKPRNRRGFIALGILAIIAIVILSIWGWFS